MRIAINEKNTLTIFREHYLKELVKNKYNLVACGTPRGGTSILGILMKIFNFNLGDNIHPTVYEDMSYEGIPIDSWGEIIKSKVYEYPDYSLKIPIASKRLDIFESNLPKPVFVCIIRNPFSIAKSLVKHDPNFDKEYTSYIKGLSNALEDYRGFLSQVQNIKSPFIIVEHEKISKNPDLFVREFIEVLNVKTDENTIQKAIQLISTPGYKRIE